MRRGERTNNPMKTKKNAKSKGTILIADYDFGDVGIEQATIERAGFKLVAAQRKNEDEVIENGRDVDGVLVQYAPIDARHQRVYALPCGCWISSMSRPPPVAAYRSRMSRRNGAPRRLTPLRSGSPLPARSAGTTGQSGAANGTWHQALTQRWIADGAFDDLGAHQAARLASGQPALSASIRDHYTARRTLRRIAAEEAVRVLERASRPLARQHDGCLVCRCG
jgi:hypothetical protein